MLLLPQTFGHCMLVRDRAELVCANAHMASWIPMFCRSKLQSPRLTLHHVRDCRSAIPDSLPRNWLRCAEILMLVQSATWTVKASKTGARSAWGQPGGYGSVLQTTKWPCMSKFVLHLGCR